MFLWRISNFANLEGLGGLKFPGRWHSKGHPIIYTSEHPAGALSEMLVHLDRTDFPETFQLLKIEVPNNIVAKVVQTRGKQLQSKSKYTRSIGDRWLKERRHLLLRVPSAIVPDAYNVLINPLHADARRLKIVEVKQVPLDPRLV
ncbi:MAG: RES family NAD+ phosphorylase [Aestuariivirga sp.]